MKQGINISHHNNNINWNKVSDNNIKFAFAKATEGETHKDSKFQDNLQGMKDNDIEAGAYHVFRMSSLPSGQYTNIVNVLHKAGFRPGIDKLAISATTGICSTEQTQKCDNPALHTNEQRAEKLDSLLTALDESGYNPIIYASPKTWNSYFAQEEYNFSKYPLWVADWRGRDDPQLPKDWQDAGKSYEYYNHTNKGTVEGITGNVNLDSAPDSLLG